jgi:AcrR family transcriptional regulator
VAKLPGVPAAGTSAKSDARRQHVVEAAVACFAHKGFYGTTTNQIAQLASISQPYLYRLFANKEAVFVAAVDHVGGLLSQALITASAAQAEGRAASSPQALLAAYGGLIEDRDVLRFLMHANCATDEPVIRDAVRACYAQQVTLVHELLDGDQDAVRRWFGAGMLENVVATLDLADVAEPWATTLAGGGST